MARMAYTKVTACVVVEDEDVETFTQLLDNALDRIDTQVTTYREEIETEPAPEPENADEIKNGN